MEKVLPGAFVPVSVPPEQLSVNVGAVHVTTAWQDALALTVILEGQPEMTGFVASRTITLKEQVETFPATSVAVYVTPVVPMGNVLPGDLVVVNAPPEQLSVNVGAVQATTAWHDELALTIIFEGHPEITGLVTSWTVTLKEQVEIFPDASVAVYVTGVVPMEKVLPGAFVVVSVPPEQLSVNVGAVQVTTAWHDALALTVIFEGQPEITGLVTSWTITLKEQVEVLPAASVAVYVTGVVPTENVLPGALVVVSVPPAQLSVNVGGVQVTTAWQDALALTVIFEGQPEITGFTASWTITLKEQVDVLPAASVAVYVTGVVPMEKVLPGAFVVVSVPPAQLSVNVGAVQVTTAWQDGLALTVMFEGQPEITGLVTSWTVTLNEHVEVLPAASVAV
jgi:uncharacterized protein YunC (DUF1805 family)